MRRSKGTRLTRHKYELLRTWLNTNAMAAELRTCRQLYEAFGEHGQVGDRCTLSLGQYRAYLDRAELQRRARPSAATFSKLRSKMCTELLQPAAHALGWSRYPTSEIRSEQGSDPVLELMLCERLAPRTWEAIKRVGSPPPRSQPCDDWLRRVFRLLDYRKRQTSASDTQSADVMPWADGSETDEAISPRINTPTDIPRLAAHLREQAEKGLRCVLPTGDRPQYIPLDLKLRVSRDADESPTDRAVGADDRACATLWRPFRFDATQLETGSRHLLCGNAGAGKTTFLCHLQYDMCRSGEWLVFRYDAKRLAERLEKERDEERGELERVLLKTLGGASGDRAIKSGFEQARDAGHLLIIVDWLDQLDAARRSCVDFVRQLDEVAGGIPLIIAGRPTSAELAEKAIVDVKVVHVAGLTARQQKRFHKPYWKVASSLARRARDTQSTPAYAYVLRELARRGERKAIRSKSDLYGRFIEHMLLDHLSNISPPRYATRGQRTQRALARLCYMAIDHEPPLWMGIPARYWRDLPQRDGCLIEEVAETGLANLVRRKREPAGLVLELTHQSFQEAFAATWAAEGRIRAEHVVRECWNPKWHGVLQFLSGKLGQRVVCRIAGSEPGADPLHSRLFLAARCAGETTLDDRFERTLIGRLVKLLDSDVFAADAFRALLDMNTRLSRREAWRAMTSGRVHLQGHSRVAYDRYESLFSRRRLEWLMSTLESGKEVPTSLEPLLAAWIERVPAERAAAVYSTNDDGTLLRPYALAVVARRCGEDALARELASILASPPIERWLRLQRLLAAVNAGVSLSAAHVSTIVDHAAAAAADHSQEGYECLKFIARILDQSAASLAEHQLAELEQHWRSSVVLRGAMAPWAPALCSRMSDEVIDQLVEAACDGRVGAQLVLRHCSARIRSMHIDTVVEALRDGERRFSAIKTAAAIARPGDHKLADLVLTFLKDEDESIRTAAQNSVRELRHHVGRQHARTLERSLRRAHEKAMAAVPESPEWIHWRVETADIVEGLGAARSVRREVVPDSVVPYVRRLVKDGFFCKALRLWEKHLRKSDTSVLVSAICEDNDPQAVAARCEVVPASRVATCDVQRLLGLLSVRPLAPIVDLLRRIEQYGGLKSPDERGTA